MATFISQYASPQGIETTFGLGRTVSLTPLLAQPLLMGLSRSCIVILEQRQRSRQAISVLELVVCLLFLFFHFFLFPEPFAYS